VAVFTAVQRLEHEFQMRLLEKLVLVPVGFAALALGGGLLGVAGAFVVAAIVAVRVHRELEGLVARTSGALDINTRTLTVELHFPNPNGALYAGMYGQVRLTVGDEQPVLTIPTSAVVFNAEGMNVATVRDDKVQFKKVSVGRDMGTEMEVLSGLDANDVIVSNPGARLSEGTAVKSVPMQDAATAQKPAQPPAESDKINRPSKG